MWTTRSLWRPCAQFSPSNERLPARTERSLAVRLVQLSCTSRPVYGPLICGALAGTMTMAAVKSTPWS
jgi:hypothetical protein